MTVWSPVEESKRYGVAIHNFPASNTHHLSLDVGDLIHIERECPQWYYGNKVRNQGQSGIFPKSYVELRDCIVEGSGNREVVHRAYSPIVREITQTLREWDGLWKQLYLNTAIYDKKPSERFNFVEVSMRALLELRREILSGTLPQDKLKKVERTAIYSMERGNRQLGMDLTIRWPSGKLVDPFEVSTSQLNSMHDEINERTEKNVDPVTSSRPSGTNMGCSLYVTVRNFVCKMSEDAELLMSLYDGILFRQITESYVVQWSRGGLVYDIEQLHNLNVIFTDLGLSDTKREKVYLVCYAVRCGSMEPQSMDNRRSTSSALSTAGRMGMVSMIGNPRDRQMRRPFGVAIMEVTRILNGQQETSEDTQMGVPFHPCEKETLDSLLKKLIANKENKTGNGLWISMKLMKGDMRQIREDYAHLMVGNIAIARKMGFPDVILPGDARNDLYMTLVGGSFTKGGGKSTDRNIEVTVQVADKYGRTIPGVISLGGGMQPMNEYSSVVYYHENKPRWQEVFKIFVPIDEFKQAHVIFLFRHRSSNEAKDKAERHFALSYTPLMLPNGTTLNDTMHNLCVYKIDSKKWPSNEQETAAVYMSLPSQRSSLPASEKETKIQKAFLSLIPKDVFTIETNVCSTKLTQNVDLLGVLNWVNHVKDGTLRSSLKSLRTVPGEEVVKFLQDILDALFNILTQVEDDIPADSVEESYEILVFECLLCIITLVSDLKYHHFQPVVDVYIRDNFCDTLAHMKLLKLLSAHILQAETSEGSMKSLLRCMKCLECLVRFIVRSLQLYATHAPNRETMDARQHVDELLNSMVWMMQLTSDSALTSQGTCIKYLPATVCHIIKVYPDTKLSEMIGRVLDVLPITRLTKQRLMTVLELVQGPLFLQTRCRAILIPHIASTLKNLIQNHDESTRFGVEVRSKNRSVDKVARVLGASRRKLEEHRGYGELLELSIKTLSELLTLLHRKDVGSTSLEYQMLATELLRTVISTTIQMQREGRRDREELEKENPMLRQIVSVLLDMLRLMTPDQYSLYTRHIGHRSDVMRFLADAQEVLHELVRGTVYKPHWADMIHMQNYIILNTLQLFSTTLCDVFYDHFERQLWLQWFRLTIDFTTQPALQLERMRPNQRKRILAKYDDMRRNAAFLIKTMWFNLRVHKRSFIPCLIGPFLEVSLTPEVKVRKATIPLFFDMMKVEQHYSEQNDGDIGFKEFENEMIDKLDTFVESGGGDPEWRALFVSMVGASCCGHEPLRESGSNFVAIIGRLIDTLLLYRDSQYKSVSHHMQVTTYILDFYSEIKRPHMYIRYVNKLCELHCASEHWAEAGLSLRLHATLLTWSDAPLAGKLKHPTAHADAVTHRQLKEALYLDMIEYLHRGKMWELAVEVCKELVTQYEEEVFDYFHLSSLYREMSQLYKSIMTEIRPHPEYFRVVYYGLGFPEFLRDKGFIFRGREYERLQEFTTRLLNAWPNAEVMTKLETPGEEIVNSQDQYLQINAVRPLIGDRKKRLSGKPVAEQILNYYKYNNVDQFMFSRPVYRKEENLDPEEDPSSQNEFASLWLERTEITISETLPGILRWFPIIESRTFLMSPLEVAIEKMQEDNRALKSLVLEQKANDSIPLEPLTRKLNGTVDAAVMGGIVNYERAFFTPAYLSRHPDHAEKVEQLKELIADQIPLLEFGVKVHGLKAPAQLLPLHRRIVECFEKMRTHVYENYGQKSCDLSADLAPVTMRRHIPGDDAPDSRISALSRTTSQCESSSNRNTGIGFKIFPSNTKSLHRNSFDNDRSSSTVLGQLKQLPGTKPRRDKDKKRNRKSEGGGRESGVTSPGTSMWYTGSQTPSSLTSPIASPTSSPASPLLELRQQLIATRPLRSEVERERRMSQRPSSIQSGFESNRNSVGTTDSNQEQDEDEPPPLPVKTSKAESRTEQELIQAINTINNNGLTKCDNGVTLVDNGVTLVDSGMTILDNGLTVPDNGVPFNYDIVLPPRDSFLHSCLTRKAPTPPPKKNKAVTYF